MCSIDVFGAFDKSFNCLYLPFEGGFYNHDKWTCEQQRIKNKKIMFLSQDKPIENISKNKLIAEEI